MDRNITERRINLRIKRNQTVSWEIKGTELKGNGFVRNVSTSGMLLEVASILQPQVGSVLLLENQDGLDWLPKKGRLLWSKKKLFAKDTYNLGIDFDSVPGDTQSKLLSHVQKGVADLAAKRRTMNLINFLLIVLIICLSVVSVALIEKIYRSLQETNQRLQKTAQEQAALAQTYFEKFQENKNELEVTKKDLVLVEDQYEKTNNLYIENQAILEAVKKEFEATKIVLKETEEMLAQAKLEQTKLRVKLQSKIDKLQKRNNQLNDNIAALQRQVNFYEGDIANLQEGQTFISLYKKSMKVVKGKMKNYKREANRIQQEAQRERDRLRSIIGNNGFLVKEGADVVVDYQKYNELPVESEKGSVVEKDDKTYKVDVKFVE